MKRITTAGAVRFALFTAAGAAACAWAPQAAADDAPTTDLGTQADVGGGQQWTVTALQPSADSIPMAPAGSLWEATATDAPAQGGIPVVPGFTARTPGGDNYPVLWTVPTAQGINPSALPAGGSTTGKLYFDVTGAAPDSVAYTRDGQDLAVWVQPPPVQAPAPATYGSGANTYIPVQAAPAPAGVPATGAPAPAAPAPATGSSGTPAPAAGSSGTPLPATGSAGTPATPSATPSSTPSATPATPAPASATAPAAPASTAPASTGPASTAPAAPASTSPASTAPAAGTPTPAATPAPAANAPQPTSGSSGTPFTVTTTPVPAPGA